MLKTGFNGPKKYVFAVLIYKMLLIWIAEDI